MADFNDGDLFSDDDDSFLDDSDLDFGSSDLDDSDLSDFSNSSDMGMDMGMDMGSQNSVTNESMGDDFQFEENATNPIVASGNNNLSNTNNSLTSPEEHRNKDLKTAGFAIATGLVILAVVGFSARLLLGIKNAKKESISTEVVTQNNVAETKAGILNLGGNKKDKVEESKSSQVQQAPVKQSNIESGWIELDGTTSVGNTTSIDSTFTITDIQHYAKVSNTNNDLQVKSKVIGSISGLIGTYELELPFEKAQHLSTGLSFEIAYTLGDYNGHQVITGIDY